MGQKALTSHMTKSKKHEGIMEARNSTSNLDNFGSLVCFISDCQRKNM